MVPCYNHEYFVGRTIHSIVAQGYPNLELIVIDDGSTDGSKNVISQFGDQISRVIHRSGFRPSPVYSLNEALQEASGELLGWLSSDDILLPNSLFTVAKVFSDIPEARWLTGQASTINARDEIVNCRVRRKSKFDFLAGRWAVIQQESTFFRRSLWLESGAELDTQYLQAFDTELWSRFFERTDLVHVDAPLGAFRRGPQSRSTRNFAEFLSYNHKAIDEMRSRASHADRAWALWWRVMHLRPVCDFMRVLPNRFLVWAFPKASDLVASYVFAEDRWRLRRRSTFRRW